MNGLAITVVLTPLFLCHFTFVLSLERVCVFLCSFV